MPQRQFSPIFLRDSKWVIECAIGIYNKSNYNIFCSQDVKVTDGKTIIYSQNLDLLNEESVTIYNNVLIIDENKSSLYADRVNYDFENKLYQINMFNKDESVKVKLSEKLFDYYINVPYDYYIKGNPSVIVRNLINEIQSVYGYINSLMIFYREILAVLVILVLLIFINPKIVFFLF